MVKVNCCDICYSEKEKLTKANRYMTLKGHPELKTFFCPDCESKIPKMQEVGLPNYIIWRYALDGCKISEEQAKEMAKR